MNSPPPRVVMREYSEHAVTAVTEATRTLAMLNAQADSVRDELAWLRGNLAEVHRDTSGMRVAALLEANEQLVMAALRADGIAETAVRNLGELTQKNQRDPLTDTPNRALMLDRIKSAIVTARRQQTQLAVLFLDLDHFKLINVAHGHTAGDEVLQQVAARLQSVIRDSDAVSRLNGDKFLILLAEVAQASDAGAISRNILSALAAPSRIGAHLLTLSASIGIATYPDDGKDAATLVGLADAAMYRCKQRGRSCFVFHGEEVLNEHGEDLSHQHAPQLLATARNAAHPKDDPALRDLREANEKLVIATLSAHEMQDQADDTHRRQITFLAMVAHELRNPLTPIRTAAELLNHACNDEPMLERLQVIIKRQVDHMSRLVEDLLDGSRVTIGKFRLDRSHMDLADTLNIAIETTRPEMDRRLQRLTVRLPPSPLIVDGDAVRLAQVFSNLLDNASKYTLEGGAIVLSAEASDESVDITIADNGIGITAAALPHIFDLFVQDAHSLRRDNSGLGIGLAVVRDLVEAHGGTVIGRSDGRGAGSEFVVTLPLANSTPSD